MHKILTKKLMSLGAYHKPRQDILNSRFHKTNNYAERSRLQYQKKHRYFSQPFTAATLWFYK